MSVDYASTILDSLNGDLGFTNPATQNITDVQEVITAFHTQAVNIASYKLRYPIAKVTALNAPTVAAKLPDRNAILAAYKKHTDAITYTTEDDTEPSFLFIMSATDAINTCRDLKTQAAEKGRVLPPDVARVGELDPESVVMSIDETTITETATLVSEIQQIHADSTVAYDALIVELAKEPLATPEGEADPDPIPGDPANTLVDPAADAYLAFIGPMEEKMDALLTKLKVVTDTDITNYNLAKDANERISKAGFVYMGLNNPMLGGKFQNVIK